MVHDLSLSNSIINQFVAELRDVTIQSDRMRFRRNLERIGEIFAYEISKTFSFELKDIMRLGFDQLLYQFLQLWEAGA